MHRKPDQLLEGAVIAATVRMHGLTLVTRNERDFVHLQVRIFNPFTSRS